MKQTGIIAAAILAVMLASASAMTAKDMTCADIDRPDVFAFCRSNTDRAGLLNCCAGAAAWKAACNVFHVYAVNHAAASILANSSRAGRRPTAKAF